MVRVVRRAVVACMVGGDGVGWFWFLVVVCGGRGYGFWAVMSFGAGKMFWMVVGIEPGKRTVVLYISGIVGGLQVTHGGNSGRPLVLMINFKISFVFAFVGVTAARQSASSFHASTSSQSGVG